MSAPTLDAELKQWVLDQALSGRDPGEVTAALCARGWDEQQAIDAIEDAMRGYLADHAQANGLPPSVQVPAPIEFNGPSEIDAAGRLVQVLAHMLHPRVIVFGGLLSADECDELVALARARLRRSTVFNTDTGSDDLHEARTSEGMFFRRGEHPLCARIEARIAALTAWPLENGEGLQILRYGPGAEYRPHHDYFDPGRPGSDLTLRRGGQRVASLVMYLNTPRRGGATAFPDAHFEVAAIKGNAVFFSYDRPHPLTATLHGGCAVIEGEKWVATKWLRERPHH